MAVAVELDNLYWVENLYSAQGNDRIMYCSSYGEAPTRELDSNPIAVSASGHTGKQINQLFGKKVRRTSDS